MEFIFSKATETDVAEIRRLSNEHKETINRLPKPGFGIYPPPTVALLDERVHILVAKTPSGEIAGFGFLIRLRKSIVKLYGIGVLKKFRGRAGKPLMHELIRSASKVFGAKMVLLEPSSFALKEGQKIGRMLKKRQAWFSKFGFKQTKNPIIMSKRLR